jgi:hypothetical protein
MAQDYPRVLTVPDSNSGPAGTATPDQGGPDQAQPPYGPAQPPYGPAQPPQYGPPQYGPAQPPQYGQAPPPQYNDPPPPPNGAYAPGPAVPATLTLQSGASLTVRVNQWLSSDRNQIGDTFYATLAQPLVVDGVVVARRGSQVTGRVTEVKKSHVDGTSRLGIQLTSISTIDGQQVPVQSEVMDRNGTTTSPGSQVGAIGATTAVGAGIGAVAGGGIGAAIGAGAGLIAGSAGVILTRGRPTEIYPESMLTFRLNAPVTISTTNASAAFHYASQEDYGVGGMQQRMAQGPPRPYGPPPAGYGPAPYGPVAYPPYGYPYYAPYYYGPGIGVYVGPGFYGGFRGGFRR